jgi:hypothetical protein
VKPLLGAIQSNNPDQIEIAVRVFFVTFNRRDTTLIENLFRTLLFDRFTLEKAVKAFIGLRSRFWDRNKESQAQAILNALQDDSHTVCLQTEVVLHYLGSNKPQQFFENLVANQRFTADVYQVYLQIVGLLSERYNLGHRELEQAWRNHPSEWLRRLALQSLVLQTTNWRGGSDWSEEQKSLLEQYRQDPSVFVASAAQFIFPDGRLKIG